MKVKELLDLLEKIVDKTKDIYLVNHHNNEYLEEYICDVEECMNKQGKIYYRIV
jgi:hypothetical protein